MRGLLALLDPWLGGAELFVVPHDGGIGEREIRHDEADARERLADVVLDVRHNPQGGGPAVGLVVETPVADERLAAGRPGDRNRMTSSSSSRFSFAGIRMA